jgi:hypothetical protein
MAGMPSLLGRWPTLSELRSSTFDHLGQFANHCEHISGKADKALEQLARDVRAPGGVEWEGAAGDAGIDQAETDVVRARPFLWSLPDAAAIARRGQDTLEAGKRLALDVVDEAERDGFQVGEDYSVRDTREVSTREELAQRQAQAEAHSNCIRHCVSYLVAHDQTIATQLKETAAGWGKLTFPESPVGAQPLDNTAFKDAPGKAEDKANRRKNQIDAFKQVFGREPVSAADWDTAAALDPHSYDPKYVASWVSCTLGVL